MLRLILIPFSYFQISLTLLNYVLYIKCDVTVFYANSLLDCKCHFHQAHHLEWKRIWHLNSFFLAFSLGHRKLSMIACYAIIMVYVLCT